MCLSHPSFRILQCLFIITQSRFSSDIFAFTTLILSPLKLSKKYPSVDGRWFDPDFSLADFTGPQPRLDLEWAAPIFWYVIDNTMFLERRTLANCSCFSDTRLYRESFLEERRGHIYAYIDFCVDWVIWVIILQKRPDLILLDILGNFLNHLFRK